MYMVQLVLSAPNRLDDVLDAWQAVGVGGATILESTGLYRRRAARLARPSMRGFWSDGDERLGSAYTISTVVQHESTILLLLEATESVLGDLSGPHTGMFSAWELTSVKGARPEHRPGV